jgi:hypothetical protein
MNVHAIMPFSRPQNKEKVLNNLRPMNIILHPIEIPTMKSDWNEDWVKPMVCREIPDKHDACYFKINEFISNAQINDDDYYFVASDDNLIRSEMAEKIRTCDTDVVFVGVLFNKRINLIPKKDNFESHKIGNCGLFNFVLKGKILKNIKFENLFYADGVLMESLFKSDFSKTYDENKYVLYDYLNDKWPK